MKEWRKEVSCFWLPCQRSQYKKCVRISWSCVFESVRYMALVKNYNHWLCNKSSFLPPSSDRRVCLPPLSQSRAGNVHPSSRKTRVCDWVSGWVVDSMSGEWDTDRIEVSNRGEWMHVHVSVEWISTVTVLEWFDILLVI